MKLVIAVVHNDDADHLLDSLAEASYRATRLASTGGFLREGNTTIIMGVNNDQVDRVLQIIRKNSRRRIHHVAPMPPELQPGMSYVPYSNEPIEVETGGATVFVLDLERYERI